jgi:hypothetical protein
VTPAAAIEATSQAIGHGSPDAAWHNGWVPSIHTVSTSVLGITYEDPTVRRVPGAVDASFPYPSAATTPHRPADHGRLSLRRPTSRGYDGAIPDPSTPRSGSKRHWGTISPSCSVRYRSTRP